MTGLSDYIQFEEEEAHFQKIIDLNCMSALKHFKKVIRSYVLFHTVFAFLFLLELSIFFAFLRSTESKPLIAIILATTVLTIFSYFVLLFYFQAKKPEQFHQLKSWYMLMCKKSIPEEVAPALYHLSMANAAYRFSNYLREKDFHCYAINSPFQLLNQLFRKISYFLHHKDMLMMKELLLLIAIEEHVTLMKYSPTDLEIHASLANAYISLAHLYRFPGNEQQLPIDSLSELQQHKYHMAMDQAIEEFKIIDDYAPDDPWVHAQLASCYHDLGMYEEEINHYENILSAGQTDSEILFRLGKLYFQQGHTSKGLKIFEKLKEIKPEKSEELLDNYSFPDFLKLKKVSH